MAEAILLGVAKSVLGQLSSPALKEALHVWNFEKDLKRLGETIETITCFIYDAEQRRSEERLINLWLSRLKAVLYDADDLFDSIAARALRNKAVGGSAFKKEVTLFFSKSNHLGFVMKRAHDIKGIRECLDGIRDDMSPFQFQYQKIVEKRSHNILEREERHPFVNHKDVIGRDKEKEDIISLLLSEGSSQHNLEVISVIGFGGLGKTTLAQLVYNDERVQNGFDMCLWVCINYFSDLESVLVKILASALKSKPNGLDLDQLKEKLRENIRGEKYLLVLDDVWDESLSNWGKLEKVLSCGKIGSKVLITTRKTKVAECLRALEPFYKLSILSKESAWSLFVKMAFHDGQFVGDSELASLGKQILRKCGYVPLLVCLIGRLLSMRKREKEGWSSFLENEFAEVLATDFDDLNVMQVLKVSYNDLPLAVKPCFAYCSMFPKDYDFKKDELILMWIAQGFIEPHASKSLEKVGDVYFFYLVNTCFFQEVREYNSFGVVKYNCRMHDLVHDLAIQVAGRESTHFSDNDLRKYDGGSIPLRHLSLACTPNSSFHHSSLSSISNSLRTLLLDRPDLMKSDFLGLVLDRFRTLRILVLSNLDHRTLPDSFEGLIHLRYLDFSKSNYLTALPNSICKLYHLQTLLLARCSSLVKLPSNLGNLVSLRHLFLDCCGKLYSMPSGLATLTTLVSLDQLNVNPDLGGLRYLRCLDDLCGSLTIVLPGNGWTDCVEDARNAKMSSKCKLNGLSIKWGYVAKEDESSREERKEVLEELKPHPNIQYLNIEDDKSDRLPGWFRSVSNIKSLSLRGCRLEYLDISVLPHLQVVLLDRMESLRGWWREVASPTDDAPSPTVLSLPRVTKLEIHTCYRLVENIPVFEAVEDLTLNMVNVRLLNMLLSDPNPQFSPRCRNSKLQVLTLAFIEGLECLPEGFLRNMTALKHLTISNCKELQWISRRGLMCHTSLEDLRILYCGDVRLDDEGEDNKICTEINDNNNSRIYYGLQRLRDLAMPWQRDNNNNNMYYGWQKLHKLEVPWQRDLLQEGLRFLTSLKYLDVIYTEEHQVEADNRNSEWCISAPEKLQRVKLTFGGMSCCFPNWTLHLPSLPDLTLWECGEMNVDEWVAQQTQSTTLASLHIGLFQRPYLSELNCLWLHDIPWKLLTPLHSLVLTGRFDIIPVGIQQLTSLRRLEIPRCPDLKEIPRWMIHLTSLQKLRLYECSPELKARCDLETGIDRHLISHIPTFQIRAGGGIQDFPGIQLTKKVGDRRRCLHK